MVIALDLPYLNQTLYIKININYPVIKFIPVSNDEELAVTLKKFSTTLGKKVINPASKNDSAHFAATISTYGKFFKSC